MADRTDDLSLRPESAVLIQRATQVVVVVELRRERQHRVPVVARQGGVDVREDLGRGARIVDAGVRGVQKGRDGGAEQDLRGAQRAGAAAALERLQQALAREGREGAGAGEDASGRLARRVAGAGPGAGMVLPVAGGASLVALFSTRLTWSQLWLAEGEGGDLPEQGVGVLVDRLGEELHRRRAGPPGDVDLDEVRIPIEALTAVQGVHQA